jgi:hypothetical protein
MRETESRCILTFKFEYQDALLFLNDAKSDSYAFVFMVLGLNRSMIIAKNHKTITNKAGDYFDLRLSFLVEKSYAMMYLLENPEPVKKYFETIE